MKLPVVTLALCAACGSASLAVWADCGSVPFYAPAISKIEVVTQKNDTGETRQLKFDPLKVSVFEPRQRAIILWNGEEEILLLSTDQRASERSAVLEVIPLPSEPKVKLGSFQTFEAAQKLIVEKRMWACAHGGAKADLASAPQDAGRITFAERMGAHDLAVAEVNSPTGFVDFVQNYLRDRYKSPDAPIRPEFVKVIQSYLDDGYRWFAFDVIQMDGKVQSRQPIEYRFKSDRVHYPLRISSLEKGKTEAELLVFTVNGGKEFNGIAAKDVAREPAVDVLPSELRPLSADWTGFFGQKPAIVVEQWKIRGESSKLTRDVAVK